MQLPPGSWNPNNQHVLNNKISSKKMKCNEERVVVPTFVVPKGMAENALVFYGQTCEKIFESNHEKIRERR